MTGLGRLGEPISPPAIIAIWISQPRCDSNASVPAHMNSTSSGWHPKAKILCMSGPSQVLQSPAQTFVGREQGQIFQGEDAVVAVRFDFLNEQGVVRFSQPEFVA